jgi:hypothetical protein
MRGAICGSVKSRIGWISGFQPLLVAVVASPRRHVPLSLSRSIVTKRPCHWFCASVSMMRGPSGPMVPPHGNGSPASSGAGKRWGRGSTTGAAPGRCSVLRTATPR